MLDNYDVIYIYDYKHRSFQGKTMYDSMNIEYIKKKLLNKIGKVIFLTFDQIRNEIGIENIKNKYIIYTSSQMLGYKKYIEETMILLNINNILIPNIHVLLAHENKSYHDIFLSVAGVNNSLNTKSYGDLISFKNTDIKFPIIVKMNRGSSSTGVKICHCKKEVIKFVKRKSLGDFLLDMCSVSLLQKPFHFKELRNQKRFITQDVIKDFREWRAIYTNGGRIYVFERVLKKKHLYGSGRGSINHIRDEVPTEMLDEIIKIVQSLDLNRLCLDILTKDGKVYIAESMGIHFGMSTYMLEKLVYFKKVNDKWMSYSEELEENHMEKHFVYDIVEQYEIEKNKNKQN